MLLFELVVKHKKMSNKIAVVNHTQMVAIIVSHVFIAPNFRLVGYTQTPTAINITGRLLIPNRYITSKKKKIIKGPGNN